MAKSKEEIILNVMRHQKYFTFKKKNKITTNNLLVFQYIFIFKTTEILSCFIEKYHSSSKFTYGLPKKSSFLKVF